MHALVVALNPSIDVEWRVPRVRWEEKNVLESERRWPGGKGVNVARWLRHLGARPRLLLPLGGDPGRELAAGLRAARLDAVVLPLRQPTRANVIVTTLAQGQLRFNPPGPKLGAGDWRRFRQAFRAQLPQVRFVVLGGSLPRGLPATTYRELVELAGKAGVPALLDCDGPPLAAALEARPFLIKPNLHELAQLTGRRLSTPAAVRAAALGVSERTGGWVLVSLGADGAFLANARLQQQFQAGAPRSRVRNTVGAGDALMAAVILQLLQRRPPIEWLRHGVGTGTALTTCAAGVLPARAIIRRQIRRVKIGGTKRDGN